jgi:hypothetical protein
MQDLERKGMTGVGLRRAIDRAESAGGDLGIDPEPTIEHPTQQRIATFDDGALVVILFRSHAHASFWQGLRPRTSRLCSKRIQTAVCRSAPCTE